MVMKFFLIGGENAETCFVCNLAVRDGNFINKIIFKYKNKVN